MLICYCKPETASDMRISDWSSAVCSSDLAVSALERRLRFPTSEADPGPSGGRGVVAMSDLGKTCGRGAQHRTTMDFLLLAWFRSEEHTSELQSLMRISYAVFCLKKKKQYLTTRQKTIHTEINRITS